jgi:PTS system nitrogen regulatory IIA component
MNQIAQLLPETNILLDLEATSKKRLFEQVGQLFEDHAQIARSVVFDSLFAREKLGSTGLGQGIAIPHGRIKGLAHALGAFVRPRQPIPFDAPDGKPVGQVFVLLVPEHATEEHLQLLSELAEMFSERSFRDLLATATDAASLHHLFSTWEPAS